MSHGLHGYKIKKGEQPIISKKIITWLPFDKSFTDHSLFFFLLKSKVSSILLFGWYSWFSHDVTKIQTTKLSILLRFYFDGVSEQLKTNFQTNFLFKRVLDFVIEYA